MYGLAKFLGVVSILSLGVGCAQNYSPSRNSNRLKGRMRFQVDKDSPLYPVAVEAAEKWAAATGQDITTTDDGDIPIYFVDKVDSDCKSTEPTPEGKFIAACAIGPDTLDRRIEVDTRAPKEQYLHILMHEMGHHLRGKPAPGPGISADGHVQDPNAVMYPDDNGVTTITDADLKLICENFPCVG